MNTEPLSGLRFAVLMQLAGLAPARRGSEVPFWFPRWVFISLTGVAVTLAVATGYRHDSQRLRLCQDRELGQLASGLRSALASTEALQRQSVRPPRASADGDTLEFTVARPVIIGGPATWLSGLYWDSLCVEKLTDLTGFETLRRLATVPARAWVLDRVRVYVDKEKGGLWRTGGSAGALMLASQVDALTIRADTTDARLPGLLIELAGTWSVNPGTVIRRKLYRYLPADHEVRG